MNSNKRIKERPISFKSDMVKAILKGRKSMTRRIVEDDILKQASQGLLLDGEWGQWCPYGQVGDHLWVRETWHLCGANNPNRSMHTEVIYRADSETCSFCGKPVKWKPSIFMSRWKSRITLEIINIRVERLQEIVGEDAINEGWTGSNIVLSTINKGKALRWFMDLWDSINEKQDLGWGVNPFVWVIEFRRIK